MKKEEYKNWLEGKLKAPSIKDRLSRCSKVEKSLGVDLDVEFERDGGEAVLKQLSYTIHDAKNHVPLPKGMSFSENANINQRMTDLRSAAKQYFVFRKNG